MLDLAVLGLLKEGDLHGYELNKRLKSLVGGYANSYGALYPALARLERRGWVSSTAVAPDIAKEETPEGQLVATENAARGRSRAEPARCTRLPKPAKTTSWSCCKKTPQRARFRLQLAFCRFLTPDRRLALFELRRAHLVSLQAMARRDPVQSTDPYVRSLFQRDQERRNTTWPG